jgi:hypothetical protein
VSLWTPDGYVTPGQREARVYLIQMSGGSVNWRCAESILLAQAARVIHTASYLLSGPYLDDGRNKCVRAFLMPELEAENLTHLLLVDSDIEFAIFDVVQLVGADKEVITGVYHADYPNQTPADQVGPDEPRSWVRPVIYEWGTDPGSGEPRLVPIEKWDDGWPFGGACICEGCDPVVPITSGGAGFLMIQAPVLQRMAEAYEEPTPWFHEPVVHGSHLGEDHGFFLRCAEMGIQPYAHRGVQVAHHKGTRIGGPYRPF